MLIVADLWLAYETLGWVLLRGNLRFSPWPALLPPLAKDLILQASNEAKELFGLLKFLFAVDEADILEPHACTDHRTFPLNSVLSVPNSRRERLTNNELHQGSLAPIVDASHSEFIFSDDKFERLLVKETQNSVVGALIDVEYRYIPLSLVLITVANYGSKKPRTGPLVNLCLTYSTLCSSVGRSTPIML